jgi:hypothetical protein
MLVQHLSVGVTRDTDVADNDVDEMKNEEDDITHSPLGSLLCQSSLEN